MIKANELRIGNFLEYFIKDSLDERKEWWEPNKCSIDDIADIERLGSEMAGYRPIPLTEQILNSCPDFLEQGISFKCWYFRNKNSQFHILMRDNRFLFRGAGMSIIYVETVHHLQNLIFVNTGQELEVKL